MTQLTVAYFTRRKVDGTLGNLFHLYFVAGRMCFRTYFAYHCSWLTFCHNIVKPVWGIL